MTLYCTLLLEIIDFATFSYCRLDFFFKVGKKFSSYMKFTFINMFYFFLSIHFVGNVKH